MPAYPIPYSRLHHAMVQAEWTNTVDRIQQLCPLQQFAETVDAMRFAYITLHRDQEDVVEEVERILFENLLLRPLQRIVDRDRIVISADWLWHWRKSVPWTCDAAGSTSRLYPGAPEKTYLYRFNLIEVEP